LLIPLTADEEQQADADQACPDEGQEKHESIGPFRFLDLSKRGPHALGEFGRDQPIGFPQFDRVAGVHVRTLREVAFRFVHPGCLAESPPNVRILTPWHLDNSRDHRQRTSNSTSC
jgi:hypothetical protein